ncbi:MAG: hypothetical protein LC808_44125, partial [Actinobacteria bacterium]|nr:hypothetical protein [Actinomycetota bacterium]
LRGRCRPVALSRVGRGRAELAEPEPALLLGSAAPPQNEVRCARWATPRGTPTDSAGQHFPE